MSGHSKWSQIKHKKELTDQKRGQIFSKLAKMITVAAKDGSNPETNSKLKTAIEKAKAANLPKENIDKAIKKISDKGQAQLEELLIEAIGPGGIALRIKAITHNRNRTLAEIRKILTDHESKMVQSGSLSWMFNQPVQINEQTQQKIDKLLEALDDNEDVEDVKTNLE